MSSVNANPPRSILRRSPTPTAGNTSSFSPGCIVPHPSLRRSESTITSATPTLTAGSEFANVSSQTRPAATSTPSHNPPSRSPRTSLNPAAPTDETSQPPKTELNIYNLDAFYEAYYPVQGTCSSESRDHLWQTCQPRLMGQLLPQVIHDEQRQGLPIPSVTPELSILLSKREEDMRTAHEQSMKRGPEAEMEWLGDRRRRLHSQWYMWYNAFKKETTPPDMGCTTGIPGYARRSTTEETRIGAQLSEKEIIELLSFIRDPNSRGQLNETQFQAAKAALRGPRGYGSQGLRPALVRKLEETRQLDWNDLEPSSDWVSTLDAVRDGNVHPWLARYDDTDTGPTVVAAQG
ncbi:hypothetical protein IAU60_004241 [Kwoniella sp. DSM 27419]